MGFQRDAAIIERVVQSVDPAFVAVPDAVHAAAVADMQARARTGDRDGFLLSAMRLVALAQNAHSRVIPNAAILVLPQRFVVRDGQLCACVGDTCVPVVSVNSVRVADLQAAWQRYLPGPNARRAVLAALMLAWPAALSVGGVTGPDYAYQLADSSIRRCRVAECVPAQAHFTENETGALHAGDDAFPAPLVARHGASWHVRIADLKALTPADVETVTEAVRNDPAGVVLDLRGNPGGSFLTALPLVELLAQPTWDHRCAVLVNGYTFSAAIVVAVLVAAHLGPRAALIGAPMGDSLSFWAEGGLLDLPDSGAKLRYSTARHDWHSGRPDPTTPPEIAAHLVAAGDLHIRHCPDADQIQVARSCVADG
ncbi:hypothetical protein [uncultured Tateyamaria sp.]|uniref:hypothetical protein n=1 Tax=uncultured Tateyamaria sp. TaxID=455651 RepID=UPI0026306179|nr:hypothetical protein [uncultured Tateyamaria sp.]